MSTGRYSQGSSYPSVSWADTLDIQRSALRWDVKRAMKSLCDKLAEIGEECFVVTVNISNGWVGHLGTQRGDEYIDQKSHILYDFLNYCAESFHAEENNDDYEQDKRSDTDSCTGNTSNTEDNETPIRLCRPCDVSENFVMATGTEGEEENISIEFPETLLVNQPTEKMVPLDTNQSSVKTVPLDTASEKFILMSPADFKNVTQRVLETEYQPAFNMKHTENQTDINWFLKKDGIKRKRKQSLEGVSNLSSPYADNETNTHKLIQRKDPFETERVVKSTRVLRSRNSQKKKKRESSDEENTDDDDDDDVDIGAAGDSDFDVDDANDQDWDLEQEKRELHYPSVRDNKGRFKVQSSRIRSFKKQRKISDNLDSMKKDMDKETAEKVEVGTSSNENDKLVRVNLIHSIKACGKGIQVLEGRLESVEENKDINTILRKSIEEKRQKHTTAKSEALAEEKSSMSKSGNGEQAMPLANIKLEHTSSVEINEGPSIGKLRDSTVKELKKERK